MFGIGDDVVGQIYRKLCKRKNKVFVNFGKNKKLYGKKGKVVFRNIIKLSKRKIIINFCINKKIYRKGYYRILFVFVVNNVYIVIII